MSFAPVPQTSQPSCLYSSQGNMICSGKNPSADPYLQNKYQSSCPSKVEKFENYGDNMVNMLKKSATGLGQAFGYGSKDESERTMKHPFKKEEEHFQSDYMMKASRQEDEHFQSDKMHKSIMMMKQPSRQEEEYFQSDKMHKSMMMKQSSRQEEEHFQQDPKANSKTATNIGYAVSPWPF